MTYEFFATRGCRHPVQMHDATPGMIQTHFPEARGITQIVSVVVSRNRLTEQIEHHGVYSDETLADQIASAVRNRGADASVYRRARSGTDQVDAFRADRDEP